MKTEIKLLVILLAMAVTSCKKPADIVTSKKDMLTTKSWVVQKAEEKLHTNPWVDSYPAWPSCEKDDKWVFKTDFSLEYNDSANPCSGQPPNHIIDIVTWAFAENETKVIIDGVAMLIEQLDAATLVLSTTETVGGILHQTKITLGH